MDFALAVQDSKDLVVNINVLMVITVKIVVKSASVCMVVVIRHQDLVHAIQDSLDLTVRKLAPKVSQMFLSC